jgi:beta-glucosidase
LLPLFASSDTKTLHESSDSSSFPANFLFGTASSSYQVFLFYQLPVSLT